MITLLYPVLLFIHIVSAIGLFVATGVLSFTVREVRVAAHLEAVRTAFARLKVIEAPTKLMPPLLLLSGVGMCILTWGFRTAWVDLSLAGFATIAVLMNTVHVPRLKRAERLAEDADLDAVRAQLNGPTLRRNDRVCNGLLLWLVLLMTVKPGLLVALVALLLALGWGLLSPMRPAQGAMPQAA